MSRPRIPGTRHHKSNRTVRLSDADVETLTRAGRTVGMGWTTYLRAVAIQHARKLLAQEEQAELDLAAMRRRAAEDEPKLWSRPRRETHYPEESIDD